MIQPGEHRLVGVYIIRHEEIDLLLPGRPVFVAVLGQIVPMGIGFDAVAVYGYLAGLVQQMLLVLQGPLLPPSQRIEQPGKYGVDYRCRGVSDG